MLTTSSFGLATYEQGDPASDRFALVLPGLLDSKDFPHMHSHVDLFARHGFHALSFDPPGTWESQGDISLYTLSNYRQAAGEIIEYYGNKETVIVGQSLGGIMAPLIASDQECVRAYASLLAPAFLCDERNGVIHFGEFPIPNWKELGSRTSQRTLPNNPSHTFSFTVPYSFVEDSFNHNTLDVIGSLSTPKLYVAATRDAIVPPEVVAEFVKQASEPKEFVTIDSEHDYWLDDSLISQVNEILDDFFSQHIEGWA